MASTITAKIAPLPRGDYSSSATYDKLDVVSYNGSSYMAIKSVPTGTAPTNTTYWQLLAETPTIGDGSITTNMLADGAVTDEKLASDGVLSAVDELYDAIGRETITVDLTSAYTTGQYWNSQSTIANIQTVSSYSSFAPIEVTPGRRYKAHLRGGASNKQYPLLFVAGDYTILEHSTRPGSATVMDIEGVVPSGAVYALMTANTTVITTLDAAYYNEYYDVVTDVPALESAVEKLSAGTMDMLGKTVAILGDSISTNGNYSADNPFGNVPEIVIEAEDVGVTLSAYVTEYDVGTVVGGHEILESEIGTELTFTPVVADVGKYVGVPLTYNSASRFVWWEVMQEKLGFTPIAVCWSGASITSHEGSKSEYATSYAWHEAQIRKCGIRTPGTMQRVAPDVIIIYRGTNDMTHAKYARLTADYFAPYNWQYPITDGLENDGFGFKEGISLTVKKLREAYPSAKIFLCTLNVFKRINYSHFPTNNGYNSLPQFNDAIREAADFFGIPVIDFAKDGITFENMEVDGYITESGKTHPSDKGHKVMGYKALKDFMAQNNSMA